MDNNLKLLLTPEQATNLKALQSQLETYQNILKPLRDTFANEARRAINYNRKIDTMLRESEKILLGIKSVIE